MSISYSVPSYQDKGNNNTSKTATSPQKEEYSRQLMFFVYEQVVKAFARKGKDDVYCKDLNSVDLLLTAQKKADENLRRSYL